MNLKKIHDWLTTNRLPRNLTKTKFKIFHSKEKVIRSLVPKLVINNIPIEIEKVYIFSFQGVCLDSNLKWGGYIQFLANKLEKYTGILNKLKRYLPVDILWILYISMVNSHLNYVMLGWGFACSRLYRLQTRIIRTITCNRYNAHTSPLFKSLQLLTLNDMLKVSILKFFYKYLHKEFPPYFYSFKIRTQEDTHSCYTRNPGQLQIERTRTEYADKRLRIYLPTLINDMLTDLLATIANHSLQDFTKIAKQFLIEQFTPEISSATHRHFFKIWPVEKIREHCPNQ